MSTELMQHGDYEGAGGEIMRATPVAPSVMTELTRAELDSQIATAKRYPRSIKQFMDQAKGLACLNEEIAQSCIYALPRGGKPIEGPSVRLAEIVAHTWGNLRVSARITDEGPKFITAQATVLDLERNVGVQIEVMRRITNRDGRRFNDDMIVVTSNAAISIALRNAIWKCVPAAFVTPIYREARKLAAGEGRSIESRRENILKWLKLINAKPEELYALLAVKGIEDIGLEHMIYIAGLKTSLEDGDITVDQMFNRIAATAQSGAQALPAPSKQDKLAATLKAASEAIAAGTATVVPEPELAHEMAAEAARPTLDEVNTVMAASAPPWQDSVPPAARPTPVDSRGRPRSPAKRSDMFPPDVPEPGSNG